MPETEKLEELYIFHDEEDVILEGAARAAELAAHAAELAAILMEVEVQTRLGEGPVGEWDSTAERHLREIHALSASLVY